MTQIESCCQLFEEPERTIITLQGDVNILQAGELKGLLLKAIGRGKSIQVDMSALDELDVTAIQLMCAAKKQADNGKFGFNIAPLSESAKSLIGYSGMLKELTYKLTPL